MDSIRIEWRRGRNTKTKATSKKKKKKKKKKEKTNERTKGKKTYKITNHKEIVIALRKCSFRFVSFSSHWRMCRALCLDDEIGYWMALNRHRNHHLICKTELFQRRSTTAQSTGEAKATSGGEERKNLRFIGQTSSFEPRGQGEKEEAKKDRVFFSAFVCLCIFTLFCSAATAPATALLIALMSK